MSREFAPEGLITDFDNTLVRTHTFIKDHLQKTCVRIGVESPNEETIFQILTSNPPFEKIFQELFEENAEIVLASYRENAMETHYHPTEGGAELIKKLYESGTKIIIVSNRTRKLEERLIQADYNPKWFVAIISPEKPKPDKEAYSEALNALKKSGVNRSRIYILGDSPDDFLACPDDLKSNFFAIIAGANSPEDFEKVGLPKSQIVDTPMKLLERLNG